MRTNYFKSIVKAAVKTAAALLFAAVATYGQQTINLTAGPSTLTLPDGNVVPMWGYTCGAAVTPASVPAATCAALNTTAAGWSPVVITVPVNTSGQTSLTINLTNSLSFSNGNTVPTSIMVVGQLGGGLGAAPTRTTSPTHADLGVSWATPNTPGAPNPTFAPPPQGARVQSFGTEVAANTTTSLTWSNLRPGTYLLESGTHPSIQVPMGLHGILVVTAAPSGTTPGTAYPNVSYNAEVPFEFSEIDAVQNNLVSTAVNTAGFSETMVWSGQPGGCGNPTSSTYNQCYPPAVNYTPKYYLINGRPFDKTNASGSVFPTAPTAVTSGTVLVRLVNAGSKMHMPSIVGAQTAPLFTTSPAAVANGFSIVAEDGNVPPGVSKVQSDVFMAAGKTFDVMINVPAAGGTALPIYDRELSLSGNAVNRDSGMLAYISVNGAGLPAASSIGAATAVADQYNSIIAGQTLAVLDPAKGVLANDFNVFGAAVTVPPTQGTLTLNANGTFTYVASSTWSGPDHFTYCGNGTTSGAACAIVTLAAGAPTAGISCTQPITFNASIATYVAVKTPGVLASCTDKSGYPLTLDTSTITPGSGLTVLGDAAGGFTASLASAPSTLTSYTFQFKVKNSQGTSSSQAYSATINFPAPSKLAVTVLDGADKTTQITDYRWIIEEDRTFYINPNCVSNPPPAGCPTATAGIVPTLGVNFHTSYMPYIAQGCTGPLSCEAGQTVYDPISQKHVAAVCDVGNGVCRPDTTGNGLTWVNPSQVALDPTKRYYISILPGDAANPFQAGYAGTPDCTTAGHCGHGMGGAPLAAGQTSVTILTQPSPYPPAKLSVFVFEDDFPLNGEQDGGGGIDVLSPNEPGLAGFQIHLWDAMGGNGDFTGQMTYDMFNQPLTNSLDGMIDPSTGQNACPITSLAQGITGMIVTCPKYEADGVTLSPLAGQAVIANLMPGRFGVVATPAADRIARGEEWLQTNTLDGQKAHDSFVRIGEPSYFQEFGPASFHVSIGFANPAIINARLAGVCAGTDPNITGTNCTNTLEGIVTGEHLSRTPDERLYDSGSHDTFYWSQCYASVGDPDGEDFAFAKCDANGHFKLTGLPDGDWRITTFDQWNDQLVDGLSTPVRLGSTPFCPGAGSSQNHCNMGDISATQWQTNLYTRTFIDDNKDGISQSTEGGIPFANVAVRLRDGSLENLLVTDFTGTANFNETFPLFSWYVVETDTTRYKNTGTHVVYDVGGPTDGSAACGVTGYPPCGSSTIGHLLASTAEVVSVPSNLRVPGSVYCKDADCSSHLGGGTNGIQWAAGTTPGANPSDPPSVCSTTTATPPVTSCSTQLSSGRIDAPWYGVEGWQGFPGQNNFLEFGKEPYVAGENGGIKGHVIYASTRPFDDPQMLVQTQWEPLVPHVVINLYQEGFAADGVTPTLTLVDHTPTTSWDDWAQGFHADANGNVIPNMNCPGQGASTGAIPDLFYFSLYNQPNYLDFYNSQHGAAAYTSLPNNSQFKCYDGMHNWNQIQPAPYDGMYQFPSVTSTDPTTGKPNGTNCTICTANHAVPATDLYYGLPMLPTGKYVVEIVLPQGYELVKEEDKNILIGDNFIAPVTQEFGGLGNVFIIPDQASVAASQQYPGAGYNANNAQNPTQSLGASPNNQIVPGFIPEPVWPCVGEARIVPDYISLYPQTHQVAPFAGATRNLCDRKEVTLEDQMGAIAKFYVYTSTHIASKFTGGITDDYTSEFDPFSPQFGEKFAPPDLPVSVKDWAGNEISRVYADQWGAYDGMTYSTWEVNPPNPTGYSPTMMVLCMNDPGPIPGSNGTLVTDPLFTQGYSQFCYELPFMPGTTQYLDTPVVPTSAFAGAGYNNVDCYYPDTTPAISEVDGDGVGPWVSAANNTLTINAVGDLYVPNYAYSGPQATTSPYNQKTIKRHYGFGTQCTAISTSCAAVSTVTIGGVTAPITGWSDTTITVTVPSTVPACTLQQQAQYSGGAGNALCGQLVITAGNGKQSVDTITVTVGGKMPTHIDASSTIQSAIDAASPGDLLIVDPTCSVTSGGPAVSCVTTGVTTKTTGAHNEMLLMWKPVRLQGVGAFSSIINANTQPAGKMDPWRRQVACLFGLALNGTPITTANPYDSSSDTANNGGPYVCTSAMNFSVDRLPLEATVGWDATLNGNLAELLQEPTLMGALEGAAITVLSKGVKFPAGSNPFAADTFPTGTTLLSAADCTTGSGHTNPYPGNFWCNPSRIDGLGITDSSQGGGGIFVHAWGHNLEISNNRVYNNAGTLSGGINVGQGEFPPAYLSGATNAATNAAPGSCYSDTNSNHLGFPLGLDFGNNVNTVLPYCHDVNVNVHNNYVSLNSSTGDELFSATPAGAGGVSFCTGADNYKFNYNWVCGNLSSGDGGGFAHMGVSYNADIEHNTFIFNQSLNPTIPANGGGVVIMGSPDADPPCGGTTDMDCLAAPGSVGPSDGVGQNLVINANLIMGNAAESGSGGGLRLQNVNGSDVISFPNFPQNWWHVTVTNNIIADNVAGWDGGGISLLDALNTDIINNTIVSNDTTATAGVLFNTIGAPLASSQGPCPGNLNPSGSNPCVTTSTPQPAGLVSIQNSAVLTANIGLLPAGTSVHCPANHYAPGSAAVKGTCTAISYPLLANNVFWQNGAYYIGVGALSPQFQQNVVSLYNAFTTTLAPNQPSADATVTNAAGSITITGGTGACVASSFWDLGVRGDSGPGNHASTFQLDPTYSILTNTGATAEGGLGTHNTLGSNPYFISQYCNGSRTPPEFQSLPGGSGWDVPPGISDATVPNPIFNLTPVATVDEGNNWINLRWGPLSMVNSSLGTNSGTILGNYGPTATSPTINYIPSSAGINYTDAPGYDFYGNARKTNGAVDAGAVEYVAAAAALPTLTSITPNSGVLGQTVSVTLTGTNLTGATALNVTPGGINFGALGINGAGTQITTTFTISRTAAPGAHTITVTTPAGTSTTSVTFNVENAGVRFSLPTPSLTTPVNRLTKTATITVSNTATGANAGAFILSGTPTINKLPFVGGPGTFSIVTTGQNASTCVSGTNVPAGSSCTIVVQYVPPATGTLSQAIATITLPVVGTTISPQLDIVFAN